MIRPVRYSSVTSIDSVPMEVTESRSAASEVSGDAAGPSTTADSMAESDSVPGEHQDQVLSEMSDSSVTVVVKPLLKLGQLIPPLC